MLLTGRRKPLFDGRHGGAGNPGTPEENMGEGAQVAAMPGRDGERPGAGGTGGAARRPAVPRAVV